LGIKVWICNGEVYGKRDLSPNANANAGGANYALQGGERYGSGFDGDRRGGFHRRDDRDRGERPRDKNKKDYDRAKYGTKRSGGHDKKKPRDARK
jgi:small subunit ribosomal protein S3